MKTSKQCPKCSSLRVGYLERVYNYNTCNGAQLHAPEPVGVIPEEDRLFTTNIAAGELEAYLCADCGFLETYVKAPATVPFEQLKGFRWINPTSAEAGPYR